MSSSTKTSGAGARSSRPRTASYSRPRLPRPPTPRRLQVRQQRGQIGARRAQHVTGAVAERLDVPAERLDERRVRRVGAELDARPGRRNRARGRGARHQLRDEPGLADPRLPADEDHRARRAVGDRLLEREQVVLAADQDGARASRAHGASVARRSRRR